MKVKTMMMAPQGSDFWLERWGELDNRLDETQTRLEELRGQRGSLALDVELGQRKPADLAALEGSIAAAAADVARFREMRAAADDRIAAAKRAEAEAQRLEANDDIATRGSQLEAAVKVYENALKAAGKAAAELMQLSSEIRQAGRRQEDFLGAPFASGRAQEVLSGHAWDHVGTPLGQRPEKPAMLSLGHWAQSWRDYLHGRESE